MHHVIMILVAANYLGVCGHYRVRTLRYLCVLMAKHDDVILHLQFEKQDVSCAKLTWWQIHSLIRPLYALASMLFI